MLHAATRFFAWGLITGALLSIVGAVQGQDTPCDYRIVEWGSASNAQAGAYFGGQTGEGYDPIMMKDGKFLPFAKQ